MVLLTQKEQKEQKLLQKLNLQPQVEDVQILNPLEEEVQNKYMKVVLFII